MLKVDQTYAANSQGGKNFFCLDDFSGYVNCNAGGDLNKVTLCPDGTQCSCFTATQCSVARKFLKRKHPICQRIKQAPKLSESFDYNFILAFKVGEQSGRIRGQIIRNFQTKHQLITEKNLLDGTKFFQLFVPDGSQFIIYSGN